MELLEVIESLPTVCILWKDTHSVICGCNQNFADFTGVPKDEIIGIKDLEDVLKDDQEILNTGQAKVGYQEVVTTPNGEKKKVYTYKGLWKDAQGQVKGLVACFFPGPVK